MRFYLIYVVVVVSSAVDVIESDLGHSSGDDIYFANPGPKNGTDTLPEEGSGMIPKTDEPSDELPIDDASGEPLVPIPPDTENEGSADPPIEFIVTGVAEESTMPPKEPVEIMTDEADEEDYTGSTTPFDINNIATGVPEGSTKEPYMPKPDPKPNPNEHEDPTGSSDAPHVTGFTDFSESSDIPVESISPDHWRSTTTRKIDFTISQKMDENSPGYKKLLHMLEDLGTRRKEDTTGDNQTEFYINRASTLMDSIDTSFTNPALANITAAQEYIKQLLADASVTVRQGYNQIVSLTSTPSFYYIPKRQRYLMVNQIITDMGSSGEQELWSLNRQAKTFCRNSNVDTPPYSLGNIVGNKLGNGAILTK